MTKNLAVHQFYALVPLAFILVVTACKKEECESEEASVAAVASASQPTSSVPECTTDGEVGCRTTAAFPAVDQEALTDASGSIMDDVTIAGVAGTLTLATTDIKAGLTAGSVTGALKVNCRNATSVGVFDNTSGAALAGSDRYDTVDDVNWTGSVEGEFPTAVPEEWDESLVYCDSSLWEDVSTDGNSDGGSSCNHGDDDCVFKDKITGLSWTENNPGNSNLDISTVADGAWPCGEAGCTVGADGNITAKGSGTYDYTQTENTRWWDAIYFCEAINFGGYEDWRLPTQKELLQAYVHGIKSIDNEYYIPSAHGNYWSSSTRSELVDKGICVNFGHGFACGYSKNLKAARITCVRP